MPNFVAFVASIAKLAHAENRILTHSLNQSPRLFDAPRTEAFASKHTSVEFCKGSSADNVLNKSFRSITYDTACCCTKVNTKMHWRLNTRKYQMLLDLRQKSLQHPIMVILEPFQLRKPRYEESFNTKHMQASMNLYGGQSQVWFNVPLDTL